MDESGQEGKVYKETVYRPKDHKERAAKKRKFILIAVVILILIIIFAIIIGVAAKRASRSAASAMTPSPSSEVTFKKDDPASYQDHVDKLAELLEDYSPEKQNGSNFMNCNETERPPPNSDAVCRFPLELLGTACTEENEFGYAEGKPCIALQLQPPKKWQPKFYTNETYPEELPESARSTDNVPVMCKGRDESDMENMGNLTYFPAKGYPGMYFPYRGQSDYRAPIVMVQLTDLTPGVLVNIECSVMDPNIDMADRPLTSSFAVMKE